MNDHRIRGDVKEGQDVKIAIHPKQTPEEWVEGKVEKILDDDDVNKNGIEVKINTGDYGNIKEIIIPDSIEIIKQRIKNREDHFVERKETFHFDVKENKKDKARNFDVVKAVVALMNSDGGFVYVGVNDDGDILGLERDYQVMEEGKGNDDTFERQIRESLKKYLTNESIVKDCTKNIRFPEIDGIEICEIKVTSSPKPIFVKKENGQRQIREKKKDWEFTDFYRRQGNSSEVIKSHMEFLEYYNLKFKKKDQFLNKQEL